MKPNCKLQGIDECTESCNKYSECRIRKQTTSEIKGNYLQVQKDITYNETKKVMKNWFNKGGIK